MKIDRFILTLMLVATVLTTVAQQEVYKVSKTIHKEYPIEIKLIELTGEKASITVEGWSNQTVELDVKLVSRNPDKEDAERDLQFIKTNFHQEGSTLYLGNYFEGRSGAISSNLSVEYRLKVPLTTKIKLKDLYGKAVLKNLCSPVDAAVSFGSLVVESLKGNLSVDGKYSEIEGSDLNGPVLIKTEKTDIDLKGVNQQLSIESKYGEIVLSLAGNGFPIRINSQRSKVSVYIPEKSYNYKLRTEYSTITVPWIDKEQKNSYEQMTDNKSGVIEITTSYCPIHILKQVKP